ncbi:MAG TPA: hypothetical protein VJB66_03660 [Candidatus Nanoarchaeia archaeon]|nr:hypothetical protein [Candidatus Nanoarchaeia archaeon]
MVERRRKSMPSNPPKLMTPSLQNVGHWAFLVGALIAILGGFLNNIVGDTAILTALLVLGLVVGLLNITVRETSEFLLATIALILAGVVNLGLIPVVGIWLRNVLSNLVVFVVPAAVIVALRTIWVLANRE